MKNVYIEIFGRVAIVILFSVLIRIAFQHMAGIYFNPFPYALGYIAGLGAGALFVELFIIK